MWNTFEDYLQDRPAAQFLSVPWSSTHEALIDGVIGIPDHQATWEAFAFAVALRTWVTPATQGQVTIIGDAAGVIGNLVSMRSRSPIINDVIKEVALHLAPLGLDLMGLHLWAEQNEQADQLSRLTGQMDVPKWLHPDTLKAEPVLIDTKRWKFELPIATETEKAF